MSDPGSVAYAGSRMHVLDWVENRGREFPGSLNAMLRPTGAIIAPEGPWRPTGYAQPAEALLDRLCEPLLPADVSRRLRAWWLAVDRPTASGPNWDLAAAAGFPAGRRGLVLVEAKAHVGELAGEAGGKRVDRRSNAANHARIGEAIAEARDALGGTAAGAQISRDACYQFSNRVAFAWKLAAEGIPTVLIYLGFTGDEVIGRLPAPIRDDVHWRAMVAGHTAPVLPRTMWERDLGGSRAPLWVLVRSLTAHRQSPQRHRPLPRLADAPLPCSADATSKPGSRERLSMRGCLPDGADGDP